MKEKILLKLYMYYILIFSPFPSAWSFESIVRILQVSFSPSIKDF